MRRRESMARRRRPAACDRLHGRDPSADEALSEGGPAGRACRSTRTSTAPRQEGVGVYQISTRNGRRMSAARAFLRPAMKRTNVRVETNALATKILFEGKRRSASNTNRTARSRYGPCRPRGHRVAAARSTRRSFCSCPASGRRAPAGPRHRRRPRQRECRAQSRGPCRHQLHVQRPRADAEPDPAAVVGQASGSACNMSCLRTGPLSLSMNNAGGFFRTEPSLARPNMQLYFQAFSTVIPKTGERPILTPDPWPGFSIGLSNCRPTSRGEIMIRSKNPRELSQDRRQCAVDRGGRGGNAGGGEVRAQDRGAAGHGGSSSSRRSCRDLPSLPTRI